MANMYLPMRSYTTINVSPKFKNFLMRKGKKEESYEKIIKRLMNIKVRGL
jgi:hypothetical protein